MLALICCDIVDLSFAIETWCANSEDYTTAIAGVIVVVVAVAGVVGAGAASAASAAVSWGAFIMMYR